VLRRSGRTHFRRQPLRHHGPELRVACPFTGCESPVHMMESLRHIGVPRKLVKAQISRMPLRE
jgi:hypothetical protein